MAKYVKLTKEQKDEIRRLTQLANRRIASAFKQYEKAGMSVVPREVTGGIQVREQWHSEKYALSRSVKFTSMKEYRERLNFLRSFERIRPTITEYTKAQRTKTLEAVETALGQRVPNELVKKINRMSAPELAQFWERFSEKARRLGIQYSSNSAMTQTIIEFFPEDIEAFTNFDEIRNNYISDMQRTRAG